MVLTSVYCKVNDISLILIYGLHAYISVLAKCCHASHSESPYTIQLLDATNLKMEESYANHVKDQVMDEAASRYEKDESAVVVSPPPPPPPPQERIGLSRGGKY